MRILLQSLAAYQAGQRQAALMDDPKETAKNFTQIKEERAIISRLLTIKEVKGVESERVDSEVIEVQSHPHTPSHPFPIQALIHS